ncbi:uncharacterized protein LOC134697972 [Mytilus trossulus]|uniref:uncharacterized protein LOC134697972 n=1 Tax=Mytilus trossulus TaxID=6551 RepID=UPI003007E8A2
MSDPEERENPEQEVSLRDVMKAVKTQGEFNEKLSIAYLIENNTTKVSSISDSDNLTNDYYEYEQGQAHIIFDIVSAYHHVNIFMPHTEFLWFSWRHENTEKWYKFLVLPFGLSSACYIFTKITRPLIKKWRGEGKQVLMYLDDSLGTHTDEETCKTMSNQVRQDLIQSGFVPKNEKSKWSPMKLLVFLGYSIDTNRGTITIPNERVQKVLKIIADVEYYVSKHGKVHARLVASLVGQIVSMSYVLGNVAAYVISKHLSIDILSMISWSSCIVLSTESLIQIKFWRENLEHVNLKKFSSDVSCKSVVYSDASNTGYGGYVVETPFNIAHGMWSECEASKSSTWKELNAVKNILLSMINVLKDKRFKWFSDNQNVVTIVEKGSMKPELQDIAMYIF